MNAKGTPIKIEPNTVNPINDRVLPKIVKLWLSKKELASEANVIKTKIGVRVTSAASSAIG